jgi:hypothetical protein
MAERIAERCSEDFEDWEEWSEELDRLSGRL